ncbi:MAG: hypothetical protein O7E57_09035, partial [Gammaproteobacteria bacterium]|nr:hypothetical protein [Gammaproteobacteria bacterium]
MSGRLRVDLAALADNYATFESASAPNAVAAVVKADAYLIYRRAWRPIVVAKGWSVDGQGNPLEDIVGPHYGHLMEIASQTIDTGPFVPGDPDFVRGDASGDGVFNGLTDALFILAFQFQGGPAPVCLEAADADGNGGFNGLA